MLVSWIARLFRIPSRPSRRRRRAERRITPPTFRPRLEALETRTLLNASLPQPVSIDTTGSAMGNAPSYLSSISANGQYEVFTSSATNLVQGITPDGSSHVYLRNLSSGTTTMVDIAANDADAGNGFADSPVITADGRFVAFRSNDTNILSNNSIGLSGYYEIFVRDLVASKTYLVTVNTSGNESQGYASAPTIGESNGKLLVAYQDAATDLTQGDTNSSYSQVFLTKFGLDNTNAINSGPATVLVSADSSGNGGDNTSQSPILSENGGTLGFQSAADNLNVPGGYINNGNWQLFLYNVAGQSLSLLSAEPTTPATGNASSTTAPASLSDPSLSGDQYEVFTSNATNLVNNVAVNGQNHVYLRDLTKGTTTLVDIAADGTDAGNRFADSPVITADGRFVAFRSNETNLTSNNTTSYYQIFVRDLATGQTYLVSLDNAGTNGGTGYAYTPTISDSNGKLLVAYQDSAEDLTSGDTSGYDQIFLTTFSRDNTGAINSGPATVLVSGDSNGNGGDSTSQTPVLSRDGSTLGFLSDATNLPQRSTNGYAQVYAYNIGTGTLSLVSHDINGTNGGDNGSASLSLSDNGQYFAFFSYANDLLTGVPGSEVYAWTQSSGSLTLISQNSTGGAENASTQSNPVNSGDGKTVAFVSYGSDLGSGGNGNWQVWSRDWLNSNPTNTLISVNSSGNAGNSTSGYYDNLSISDNGNVIAFESNATNLAANSADASSYRQILVRNVNANTTTLASIDVTGTNGGNTYAYTPVLSADGNTLVFYSSATDLTNAAHLAPGDYNVYAYDLSKNVLSLVSIKASGLFGGDSTSESLSLSDNGQEAAFYSDANDLLDSVRGNEIYAWAGSSLTLISQNSTGGAEGNGVQSNPVISGDGSTVAFTSAGSDLGSGGNGNWQVWSRSNWQNPNAVNTLISVNSSGNAGNSTSGYYDNLSISDNGNVIAFESNATNLAANSADASSYRQILVRNVNANTTTLASIDVSGTNGGNTYAYTPVLSGDGNTLVFYSSATDLTNAAHLAPATTTFTPTT